jgi:hypothetical protein
MTVAKYKVLVNEKDLIEGLTDKPTYKVTGSFKEVCEIKGINIKKGTPKRRIIRNLASVYAYPSLPCIAAKAGYTKPLNDDTSSKALTKAYVKEFLKTNHLVA